MQITLGGKTITLREDEELIWQGHPAQGIIRNPVHIGYGLFFIALGLWAMLALGWQGAFPGVPLALAGVYFAYFHAVVEKNRRAETCYGLTNQRALLAYARRVLAFPITPRTSIKLKKGRYDTVRLTLDGAADALQTDALRRVSFAQLENGEALFDLMKDIQKGGKNGT